MKTADLEGSALDYWVAQAENRTDVKLKGDRCVTYRSGIPRTYSPSTEWLQGGRIIEHELISVQTVMNVESGAVTWQAMHPKNWILSGPTPLIAAMRAFVASKFGPEVDDYVNVTYKITGSIDTPEVKAALERSMRRVDDKGRIVAPGRAIDGLPAVAPGRGVFGKDGT